MSAKHSPSIATSANPRFPIYIPSKGRHESRLTMRALDALGVDYYVIVEASQFSDYANALAPGQLHPEKILILPPEYQRDYDTCDSLGDSKSKGPGPARNFAWDHAISLGAAWHWVMDDNIRGWVRLNHNLRVAVRSPVIFRAMEDFVLRYMNVAMAGPNYATFLPRKYKFPPLYFNTRIYSCNLIRNDAPFRWRARYNEDTDLSLRMLKAGWCTIQFNAFQQLKLTTQTLKGGNTDEFYAREGTYPKSKMLADLHPDVAHLIWKYGRPHHHVNYRPFRKNKLIRNPEVEVPTGVNDYGMRLVHL